MANKYPYVASAGPLSKTIEHLRRSFPKEVTADTLRKLGVAPKNESYVINVLRFLGVIDEEGRRVDAKSRAFVQHKGEAFASEFEALVKEAYQELFELHGDGAWALDRGNISKRFVAKILKSEGTSRDANRQVDLVIFHPFWTQSS